MEKIKKLAVDLEIPFFLGVYALIMAFPNLNEGLMLGLLTMIFVYFLVGDMIKPVLPKRLHIVCGVLFTASEVFAMTKTGDMNTLWYIIAIIGLSVVNTFVIALFDSVFKPLEKLRNVFARMDKRAWIPLVFIAAIFCALAVYSTSNTAIFTLPQSNGALFGAKTSEMITNETFTAFPISHEMTMSAFGLAFLPMNLIAHAVALPLHFIFPATEYSYFFSFGVMIAQIVLLIMCIILFCGILKDAFSPFVSAAVCIVFVGSYSTMFSVLTVEKYLFSTFCLLLFIRCIKYRDGVKIPLFAVSMCSFAVNTMAFPLLLIGEKKKSKTKIWKTGISIILLLLLSGSLAKPFIPSGILSLEMSFSEKLTRFCRFVYGIFVPNACIESGKTLKIVPVNNTETIIGAVIFSLALLGCVLFMKKIPLMKISFCWICVSFILFGVLGLGGNNMNIYAFCFGWAYIAALAGCLKFVYDKNKFAGISITTAVGIFLLIYNIVKITAFINFGIAHIPAM